MSTVQTRTVDLKRFKNAVGFTAKYTCAWGNTRKANIEKVLLTGPGPNALQIMNSPGGEKSDADRKAKTMLALKKQLIVSPEYEAIKSFYGELRTWVYTRTVPSFFREGFQRCGLDGISVIEARMTKAVTEELPKLIQAFLEAYPAQVIKAREVLDPVGQFNVRDYPATEELRSAFDISWNWVSFTIPDELPAELRQAEQDKLNRQLTDAGEQITEALRVAFQELITHAADKLKIEPGEKPKVFRDSLLGNIQEFIDTFSSRNLMNDVDLARLVDKSKQVLLGITPQKLRDYQSIRENTLAKFAEVKADLDKMIVEKPARKFALEDDEPETPKAEEPTPGELALA